jgi:hypothetical protein
MKLPAPQGHRKTSAMTECPPESQAGVGAPPPSSSASGAGSVPTKYKTPAPDRGRWRSAQHEAAHAAAAFLFGRRIHSASITPPVVCHEGADEDDLGAAIDELVLCFAADAHVRVKLAEADEAFAEYVGARFLPPDETTLLESLGTSPAQALALDGLRAGRENPQAYDYRDAEEIAGSVTSDQFEADALLRFAALRTANLVQTPRFRALTDHLAPLLEREGALAGDVVMSELKWASRDMRTPIDRTLDSAIESLTENSNGLEQLHAKGDMDTDMRQSDNGDEDLDELVYEDLFDEDALVRRAIRSDDFNASGEWLWHEREAYMRWSSPELYEDDEAA